MSHRGIGIRLAALVLAVNLSLWGCAGRSDSDSSDLSTGRPSGGTSAAGGAPQTGGMPQTGGAVERRDSGGTASFTGGTVGTAVGGRTSSGGSTNCQTPELGACEADFAETGFVFFNASTSVCEGSAGRCLASGEDRARVFESLALCLSSCPDAHAEAQACDTDEECEISFGCCAPCLPIDPNSVQAFSTKVGPPSCPPTLCNVCPEHSEADDNREYFLARCTAHACEAYDFTRSIGPNCGGNADCVLRDGTECCQDCDGESWVPMSYFGPITWGDCEGISCPPCEQPAIGVGSVCEGGYCAKIPWAP